MSEPNAPGFAVPPGGGSPNPTGGGPGWAAPGWAAPGGWGAAPTPPAHLQPGILSRLDPRGWRTTLLVLVIMITALAGSNLLNSVVPLPAGQVADAGTAQGPEQPGPAVAGHPLTVGSGVQIYAPDGWSVVKSQEGILALGKGSAAIVVQALPYGGTLDQLEADYRQADLGAGGASAADPKQGTFGNGIPALVVVYSIAASNSGPVDGVYVVGLQGGIGVVVDLVAPQGSRGLYTDDADLLLGSVSITGGAR